MVNPVRTPTIDFANAFSSTVLTVQYQEALFNLGSTFELAGGGGTTTRSSNGTTVDDTNTWGAPSELEINIAGLGAWRAMTLGGNYGGSTLHCLLYADDTDPEQFQVRFSSTPYVGGDLSTLPAPASATDQTAVLTNQTNSIIDWATPRNGNWTSWYTSQGDVMFAVKETGQQHFAFWGALLAFSDSEGGGELPYRFAWFSDAGPGSGAMTGANLSSTSNWRGLTGGGQQTAANAVRASSNLSAAAMQWTGGTSQGGAGVDDIWTIYDISALGRQIGTFPDLYCVPGNLPYGAFDTTENGQTYRRVAVSSSPGTAGNIMAYFPTAELGAEGSGAIP